MLIINVNRYDDVLSALECGKIVAKNGNGQGK